MKSRYVSIAVMGVLMTVYLSLGFMNIRRLSLTFDEIAHLPAGYTYLVEHDFRMNALDHPPLAKMAAALPLLFLKPQTFTHHPFWKDAAQWKYGDLFMYHNEVSPYVLIYAGRSMMLGISVLLGILIFFWGRELGGTAAGLIGAGLYYTNPSFISHGGLVTTDVPMSLTYFFVFYCLWHMCRPEHTSRGIMLGLAVGAALTVKFSGVMLVPAMGILLIWAWVQAAADHRVLPGRSFLVALVVAFLVLCAVYHFKYISWYFDGLRHVMQQVNRGRGSFLMGKYSTTGWWYYFPVAFFLKTPISVSLLLAAGIGMVPRLWKSEKGRNAVIFLGVPAAVYFLSALRSPMQIGHRHILPVYPFLFVLVGWSVTHMKNFKRIIAYTLLAASLVEIAAAQPYNFEYFNRSIGSRNQAYRYLVDSNLDWGQGLKELSRYLKSIQHREHIFMAYFGTADPSADHIRYMPVLWYAPFARTGSYPDTLHNTRILFALSATQRQCVYYGERDLFSWVDDMTPDVVIAYSIFVYDLTGKKEKLERLHAMLARTGNERGAVLVKELL